MAKKPERDTNPQILDRTLELLKNRPKTLTYAQIAKDTGLSLVWLARLVCYNGTNDPGLKRIVKLYEYLSHTKLVAP